MFDSLGGDMEIEVKERPKMDWYGTGYRWHCVPCGHRSGSWTTEAEARKSGEQHAKVKHAGVPDWRN